MNKFTFLLVASFLASPAFSEEVKVEAVKSETDASKAATVIIENAKSTTATSTDDAKKTTENIRGDVKKVTKEPAKKEVKAVTVKKQKMGRAGGKGG